MDPEDLIVIHDDLDLPFGGFGSSGGEETGGIRGFDRSSSPLGENNFLRLKVGIGRPPKGMEPADYVLNSFDEVERRQLEEILSRAAECVAVMISEGIESGHESISEKTHSPFSISIKIFP